MGHISILKIPINVHLGIILLMSPLLISAQAMCPIETVKVDSIRGNVVENTKAGIPWTNVSIELRSGGEDEVLLSTVKSNEQGYFQFEPAKKGKYFLDFRHEYIGRYRLVIQVRRSKIISSKGGGLLVKLGLDCWETEVLRTK